MSSDYLGIRQMIEDTLTRMYYAVDTRQFELLSTEVFADEITADYTAMFGGEPKTRSAREQADIWRETMSKCEVTQHSIGGFLPLDLNRSDMDTGSPAPEQVTVHANVTAYLRRRGSDDRLLETRNGGRMEAVLVKQAVQYEGKEREQWRVRSFKAIPIWDVGGKDFWSAK